MVLVTTFAAGAGEAAGGSAHEVTHRLVRVTSNNGNHDNIGAGAGESAGDSAHEGSGESGTRDAGGRAQAPAQRGQRHGPPLLVAPPAPPLLPC